ncbi:MAG: hypothetical protein ILO43_06075, partial [Clostridia bacterium]|nr:hypothetical protein [Clostridia bacterium]
MTILSDLSTLFSRVISIFSTYDWLSDTLDIILLTLLVYGLLSVIKDSRALTIAKGLVFFILAYIVVSLLDMKASIFLFRKVFDNILILLAIIFAPEL